MALPSVDVNYLAILVSGIVAMIIGGLWYSPLLFGKAWMKLMGFGKKDIEKAKAKGMGKIYLVNFLASLVMFYVLAWLIGAIGAAGFAEGVVVGFWVWLGFNASVLIAGVLWENRPFNLYLINVTYWLVILLLNGGIIAVWR
jgi:flagellar biosynthesis protein FlhB